MTWDRDEIELAFIREFSTGSNVLSGPMKSDLRRDRIRLEIYRHQRGDLPLQDSGMTYAQAYRMAYGRPIEMRLVPRSNPAIAESMGIDPIDESEADPHFCHCGAIHSQEEIDCDLCDSCGKKCNGE